MLLWKIYLILSDTVAVIAYMMRDQFATISAFHKPPKSESLGDLYWSEIVTWTLLIGNSRNVWDTGISTVTNTAHVLGALITRGKR